MRGSRLFPADKPRLRHPGAKCIRGGSRLFCHAREQKAAVYRDAENPLGYYDRELTKQRRDQKEVFDFKAGGHISRNPLRHTRWPDRPYHFRPALTEFLRSLPSSRKLLCAWSLVAWAYPLKR